jgi:hypothetical protein
MGIYMLQNVHNEPQQSLEYSARRGMHIEFWSESQKERDHKEDLDVDGRSILEWILER